MGSNTATDIEVYLGAAAIGAVAGLRSMAAPAIISKFASSGGMEVTHSKIGFLNSATTSRAMTLLAAAEGIADKLPFIPNRTQAGPLIFRAISGGVSGAALCSATKRSVLAGAVFGALGAVGASYAAYELRKRATKRLHLPDQVIALVEDAVAAGVGTMIITNLKKGVQTA